MSSRVTNILGMRAKPIVAAAAAPIAAAAAAAAPIAKAVSVAGQPKIIPSNMSGSLITFLFYSSTVLFILFLILAFINFTIYPIFKLTPGASGLITVPANQDMQTAWVKAPPAPTENAGITQPVSTDFTISLDVIISSKYSASTTPHIVLYRKSVAETAAITAIANGNAGTAAAAAAEAAATAAATALAAGKSAEEVANACNAAGTSSVQAVPATSSSSMSSYSATSNLLVTVDSDTNNLKIAATTVIGTAAASSEPVATIKNISQDTPFCLTIVYMDTYVEVYINGKLNTTTILRGKPITSTNDFWPPPDTTVQVGNLRYWPRSLVASEIQYFVPVASSTFFVKKT